CQQGNTLPYTF
nr:immunoglobulin light chain junction region [Mus musculus]NSL97273.1 immunoglobulin light chain junction region [Mus musculus]NSL97321.1 immunoglobulin light chain junction region [Mus musculus]NSL97384.1 immunoglobulin light chain junction region [Mus musculus]NSL97432.1 immunoglobulin light chain junction region [Mus musculus]